VSQTCTASSANTTINMQIQTLSGSPVNNVTISPTTSCLNTIQITQLVEQYCVGCTVIVIPPPPPTPPVIYVPEPGTNTVTVVNNPAPLPPVRVQAYCMPHPIVRPDGTTGSLLYLPLGEPQRNPAYAAAIPALYTPGVGMKCPAASGATSPKVPMFTLTVPASFVGQVIRLCLQPTKAGTKPLCHSIRIDLGATIAVPVVSNVVANVVKSKAKKAGAPKGKAAKRITRAANAFSATLTDSSKTSKGHSGRSATTRKGS
jgi:hypothetical protein